MRIVQGSGGGFLQRRIHEAIALGSRGCGHSGGRLQEGRVQFDHNQCRHEHDPISRALRIAVIPKGTTHAFWRTVEAGAKDAGQKLNAEIIWKGPVKEDDRTAEIQVVEQFVGEGVSGIVLAPLDSKATSEARAPGRRSKDSGCDHGLGARW